MSELVVYPSAARTATPIAVDIDLVAVGRGLLLVVDVTAVGVTPSVVPTIDGVDVASGKTFNLLTGAALTAVVTRRLVVAQGITVAANLSAADVLPERVRITMTHGNGITITYSVTAHLLS